MLKDTVDVATLSLIQRENGTSRVIEGFRVYGEEVVVFSVTVIKRDGHVFVRDTLNIDDLDLCDETRLYDSNEPARVIVEKAFERTRERWEKSKNYATSV